MDISLESENKNLSIRPTDELVGETVRIVFPQEVFKDKPKRFIKSHAENMNAKVTVEPDGTVIFTMLSSDRDKIVGRLRKDIAEDAGFMTEGKFKVDFVKKSIFSPDYSEMTIYVDGGMYAEASPEAMKNFNIDGFAYDCGRIQLYSGIEKDNISVDIVIKDNKTGKEIKRITYPDNI